MKAYKQIKIKERYKIYELKQEEKSVNQMANNLGRHRSSIYRELSRNKSDFDTYLPDTAQKYADNRKARHGKKLSRYRVAKLFVTERLKSGWSPEAIAGRMKTQMFTFKVCSETIYKYIYSNEGIGKKLYKYLLKCRTKRGLVHGRKHNKCNMLDRTPLSQRPERVNNRTEFGHLEGDLTFFKGSQSENIAVVIERKSRFITLLKNHSKKSIIVGKNLFNTIAQFPKEARKSITFDNGAEFAKHTLLKHGLNMETYFCDPHSPWQKGQVEQANANLHRFIPKSSNIKALSQKYLYKIQYLINNTPKKCLGFKTPAEVFSENLLLCRTSN